MKDVFEVGAIIILILGLAFIVPAIFVAQENPKNIVLEQNQGSTETISGSLETVATNVTEPNLVNITLINRNTGETYETGSISEGSTDSTTFNDGEINITATNILDENTVLMEYDYPVYIGWPSGASTIVENIMLIIIGLLLLILLSIFYISV